MDVVPFFDLVHRSLHTVLGDVVFVDDVYAWESTDRGTLLLHVHVLFDHTMPDPHGREDALRRTLQTLERQHPLHITLQQFEPDDRRVLLHTNIQRLLRGLDLDTVLTSIDHDRLSIQWSHGTFLSLLFLLPALGAWIEQSDPRFGLIVRVDTPGPHRLPLRYLPRIHMDSSIYQHWLTHVLSGVRHCVVSVDAVRPLRFGILIRLTGPTSIANEYSIRAARAILSSVRLLTGLALRPEFVLHCLGGMNDPP